MTQRVFIAVPSKTGQIDIGTNAAMIQTMCTLQAAQKPTKYRPVPGDSIIARVRNALVHEFMATDCTDLVFIDDDLTFDSHGMLRLLSHDVDVVGGAYLKKQAAREYPVRLRPPGERKLRNDGLMECNLLPTGFLRIRRPVIEQMLEAHQHLRYRCLNAAGETEVHTALFWVSLGRGLDAGPDDLPELWGEDFTFCERWRAMGGTVYLDTLLRFGHSGRTTWWGCYAEDLTVAHLFERPDAPAEVVAEAAIAARPAMPKRTVAEAAE